MASMISHSEYADSPVCIYCESTDFQPIKDEVTDCEVNGNIGINVHVRCYTCYGTWWETYQLVGFDRVR